MEILLRPANEVPEVFVERLKTRTPQERALATTMTIEFDNNPITDGLIEYGLPEDVLAPDYFGHDAGPSARMRAHKGHRQAQREFETNFPGEYVVLGEPEEEADKWYHGRVWHRSHIKALAVGSKVLSLGGVNFTDFNYENCVDAMLDFESEEFVDFLDFFIRRDGELRDFNPKKGFNLTDQSEVLVDVGRSGGMPQVGNSLIRGRVFSDIFEEGIRSLVVSSTYAHCAYIEGALRNVAAAGNEAVLYTNSLRKFRGSHASMSEGKFQREGLISTRINDLIDRQRQSRFSIIDCLPDDKFNHLKAIVAEKKDKSKVAYIGSSNFQPIPAMMGTAEIALRTTDNEVIDQIEGFIADNLAPSRDRSINWLFGARDVVRAFTI
jgi:hypothetical protein